MLPVTGSESIKSQPENQPTHLLQMVNSSTENSPWKQSNMIMNHGTTWSKVCRKELSFLIKYKSPEFDASFKGGYDAEPEKKKGISLLNTTFDGSNKTTSDEALKQLNEASQEFNAQPAFIEPLPIETVHYVNRSSL